MNLVYVMNDKSPDSEQKLAFGSAACQTRTTVVSVECGTMYRPGPGILGEFYTER